MGTLNDEYYGGARRRERRQKVRPIEYPAVDVPPVMMAQPMMQMPPMNNDNGMGAAIEGLGNLGAAGIHRWQDRAVQNRAKRAIEHVQNQPLSASNPSFGNDYTLPQLPYQPMQFRSGGSTLSELGKVIRYGEQRPEVATDEEGNQQLLTSGMGVPVRPALINPSPDPNQIREAILNGGNPSVIPVDRLQEALSGSRGMNGAAMNEPLQSPSNDDPKWWERSGVESMGRLQDTGSIANAIRYGADNTLLQPRPSSGIDVDALMAAVNNKGDGSTLRPLSDTLPAPQDMSAQGINPDGLRSALLSPRVPPQQFPPDDSRLLKSVRQLNTDASNRPLETTNSGNPDSTLLRERPREMTEIGRQLYRSATGNEPPAPSSAIRDAILNSPAPNLGNGGLPASPNAPDMKMGRPPEDNSPPGLRRQIRRLERLISDGSLADDPENKPPRWRAAVVMALEGIAKFAAQNPHLGAAVLLGGIAPALAGGINPKIYADSQHRQKIDELMDRLKREDAWGKQDRDAAGDEADRQYKLQQTASLKQGKWTKVKQGGYTYMVNSNEPNVGHPISDDKGNPLPPDQRRPVMIDVLGDDGVTVGKSVLNPDGTATPITQNGQPVITKRVEKVDTDTGVKAGTTANITSREGEGEKNRAAANTRAAQAEAGRNQRAALKEANGGMTPSQVRQTKRQIRRLKSQETYERDAGHRQKADKIMRERVGLEEELYGTGANAQGANSSGQYTEQQVRERARARGKDENSAVEAARKAGKLKGVPETVIPTFRLPLGQPAAQGVQ